jgi:hypothetical protein
VEDLYDEIDQVRGSRTLGLPALGPDPGYESVDFPNTTNRNAAVPRQAAVDDDDDYAECVLVSTNIPSVNPGLSAPSSSQIDDYAEVMPRDREVGATAAHSVETHDENSLQPTHNQRRRPEHHYQEIDEVRERVPEKDK